MVPIQFARPGPGKGMPERERRSFGILLRSYRRAANLSQEELAARAGLSAQAISTLERGARRRPRTSTVELLARALSLSDGQRTALVAASREQPDSSAGEPPGTHPPQPCSGVPPDPTAHFVGREAELADLRGLLGRGGRVAVHGLGGVGKTQLLVRYLRERAADYPDGTFWLRADEESSLVGDLASLAWRLRLPEREAPEQERQVEAVLRWLHEHPRWLLALDNVEPTVLEALRDWLPPGLPGHVVATSRTSMWPARLALGPLAHKVATRFLLDRTGQRDASAAGEVAERLGCLPLALEQAAAYVEASGRDLAGYAQLLRTRLIELMAEGRPDEYPQPLAGTWQISLERLGAVTPPAVALLRLCAFFAPDDIPITLLRAGATALPSPLREAVADDIDLDRTMAVLRRYSLAERQHDGLRVHRLVQAVVRESMLADDRQAWASAAICILLAKFPERPDEEPARWPLWARLVPHCAAVMATAGWPAMEAEALGSLMDRVGLYLWGRGQPGQAERFLMRAVACRERCLGRDHPLTVASLGHLVYPLLDLGRLADARTYVERALAARERSLGPDHPAIAESLNSLGVVLRLQGELLVARRVHERALAIRERALPGDTLEVAESLSNLGILLRQLGEFDAARSMQERALAIRRAILGTDHWLTTNSLNNLGRLLAEQGDAAAARAVLEEALAVNEQLLGPDDRRTARSRYQLALVLWREGSLATAEAQLERALLGQESVLGRAHRTTVDSRSALEAIRSGRPPP